MAVAKAAPQWLRPLARWCYYKSYFPQLGMLALRFDASSLSSLGGVDREDVKDIGTGKEAARAMKEQNLGLKAMSSPMGGLRLDDTMYETPEVKEALRRLPKDLYWERQFRISRALHLSMKKEVLPKDEWTKYEEDGSYLKPYLEQVKAEQEEKSAWKMM